MQLIVVSGRLAQNPDMRYTPTGTPVTSFSIPVDIGFGDNKHTVWHRCSAWAKTGEVIAQYCKKGDWLECYGTVESRAYKNREGEMASSLEVRVDRVNFGPKGKNHDQEDGDAEKAHVPTGDPQGQGDEDDLPF